MPRIGVNQELSIVALSLLLQTPLAVFLGHYYDVRVFMATGYLVNFGLNPYQQHDFTNIFSYPLLGGIVPGIGYPPPWPLVLGLIYHVSFGVIQNFFFYNFAIKVPVITANVILAYLVRNIIIESESDKKKARTAWLFLLFNPFILLVTTAWGQIDSVVSLLCVVSLYFLSKSRINESALSLALGIAIKPIAIPIIGLPYFSNAIKVTGKKLQYMLVFSVTLLTCYFLPFLLLGWSIPLAPTEVNAQLRMAGGMTLFNLIEVFQVSSTLPPSLEFLGYLWLPALLVGYCMVYRSRPASMSEVVRKSTGLMLIFFLTRSWLSEPNIAVLLPLMILAVKPSEMNLRNFHFAWIAPLVFMFLNLSFPQLFFLVYPSVLAKIAAVDQQIQGARLMARFAVTLIWQVLAWRIVCKMIAQNSSKQKKAFQDNGFH